MTEQLDNLLHETRTFPPSAEFAAQANVGAEAIAAARADRIGFWEEQARRLTWRQPWTQALEWDLPFAKWFVGGQLNVAENCLDRHVAAGLGDRVAIHWVGEPADDTRDITYAQLLDEVKRAANALTALGVQAGDRV
ncbi:MAG: AMP-binding protein, partial [Frankiaceae bacterium]|nr:AMP-binding protein [Frankiaceae bacterium]